ncbi:zwei Ig domain protein zig-8-like isoform X1 [Lutzomyia longipalpis]|uniref:zwei Ig domain protein zig-8-like isoform X1 n=1 Tax=Lutzomyia longipalpis TaxID=7200 RepID=UPI002483F061|nr:zwei Ig domain protein zig-8-like isoform X1 [Lutzomyia longipalpis]
MRVCEKMEKYLHHTIKFGVFIAILGLAFQAQMCFAENESAANLQPYFDFNVQRNVTVIVGQTAFLHCNVERLGDKDVSWIRKRDLHILTAGRLTYTSDQRFQIYRRHNSTQWNLMIKYPQMRDSGVYECQINTEPKMSLSYTLNVIELKADILGPSDIYVKSGSDIDLICKLSHRLAEGGNVFWYKDSDILEAATNANEISSDTSRRITVDTDWADGLTSRVTIRRAVQSDTGNYTCSPSIAPPAQVYVHVIIGEHPAAMQHNSTPPQHVSLWCTLFLIAVILANLRLADNR